MYHCSEPGCEEKFEDLIEFKVHTSYHEYHQKIKDHGKSELELLEKRFNTRIECPLADRLSDCYYFPQLPTRLVCGWYDCGWEFSSAEDFYTHVSLHANRLCDKCYWNDCNKNLSKVTTQLLREHLRVHTLQKLFACPFCGNFFSTKIKFDDHFLRHLPVPDFLQNKELNPSQIHHVINVEGEDLAHDIEEYDVDGNRVKIFRCSWHGCERAFFTSSLLREHNRDHSSKNRCDQCDYVAKSLSRLKSHKLYRHQTERNFECTICSKNFKQRGDLRAHVKRHQIVAPYKCDKCDFETLNEEGLNTHLKLHDKNHDYCCHLCQRVFSRGNNLSRHLKSIHHIHLPDGQSRFKFKLIDEGVYLLDTQTIPGSTSSSATYTET